VKYKLIPALVASMFAAQTPAVYADATQDLIDALVTKGVLTEDEGALLGKGRASEKKSEGTVKKGSGFELVSPDGKSNMKFAGRVQLDWRNFDMDTDTNEDPNNFDIRRAYLGVSGEYNEFIGYKLVGSFDSSTKLDEAYINLGYFEPAQLTFGQFKTSMSLEERTSSRFLNFTERSYVNNASITEGKDKGIMLHGTPTKGFNYSLAVVNGYGQNNDTADQADDKHAYIAHVDSDFATMNKWEDSVFHVGANAKFHEIDVSQYDSKVGISQQTIGKGYDFFDASINDATSADLRTFGVELALAKGPVKVQAEYATTEFDSDTNNQDIDAGYIEAGWLVTGESYSSSYKSKSMGGKFDRIKPNSSFNPENGKGIGAWELVAGVSRFDASDFTAASAGYNIGAGHANEATSYRAGVKWIIDPNTRMLFNYIKTDFDYGTGSSGDNDESAINFRTQFDF
jgi:phosphate-selective porin OprO/OprP